jgi:hypothetical protein
MTADNLLPPLRRRQRVEVELQQGSFPTMRCCVPRPTTTYIGRIFVIVGTCLRSCTVRRALHRAIGRYGESPADIQHR